MSGACRLLDSTNLLNLQNSQFENNLKAAKENLKKLKENQRTSRENLRNLKENQRTSKESLKTINIANKENSISEMRLDYGPLSRRPAPLDLDLDYDYFLNTISKGRRPAELRELTSLIAKLPPDAIKFGVGVPNGSTFPFKEIKVTLKDNSVAVIDGERLAEALQYLPSSGMASLISTLKDVQDRVHGTQDWTKRNIIITAGAQEGLCKVVEMVVEPGDAVILQNPVYTGVLDCFRPYQCEYIAVDMDQDGMRPDILREMLADRKREQKPMPKIMYVNPTAANPCGVTLSEERKREIYQMACEYNFLILEDDPYYYLGFDETYPISFLSMDTEGRVLRCDSFSKILSSGLRLGFVTGPMPLLRRLELHMQVSTLHASALSQVVLYQLLKKWGFEGLREHFAGIKKFYRQKRDLMIAAAQKHLTGLAEWNNPSGGMFLWLRVKGIDDARSLVTKRCVDNNLVCAPGYVFMADGNKPCPYMRLSFSLCSAEQIDMGISRLARLIREEQLATRLPCQCVQV